MERRLSLPIDPARTDGLPHVVFALSLALGLLLLGYPIVAFAASTLGLITLPVQTPAVARRILAVTALCSVSMMMGARPIGVEGASDDIEGYYHLYEAVFEGDIEAISHFGGGFEVALPALFYLWSLVLPKLSVNGLMMCFALTSSALLLLWIESAFYGKREGPQPPPALLGAAVLMFNLYFSTQLARQFDALILLLFAMTQQHRPRRWMFVAAATAFHVTALPFYGAYLVARRGVPGVVALLAGVVVLRTFFGEVIAAIDILPPIVAEKLVFYVMSNDQFTEADLTSFRGIVLLCMISVVGLITSRHPIDAKRFRWHAIPWVAVVVHYLLLPIPLASLRTTLIVHSIVPGLVAYQLLPQYRLGLIRCVLGVLLAYKVLGYIGLRDMQTLLPTFQMILLAFH